jgi:hypothetical protein
VIVPSGAADGPIRVSTFNDVVREGAVLSDVPFNVPPPDGVCDFGDHARSVSLRLVRSLVARGVVRVEDGFTECVASVPVRIQRRAADGWKTVTKTTTRSTGAYRKRIHDKPGRYRVTAPAIFVDGVAHLCFRTISPVRTRS